MSKVYEFTEAEFIKRFAEIEAKRPEAVKRGVASAILLSAEIVARSAPKDLGNLKRSVRGVVQSPGGYVVVDAPYASMVELGTRPHWAPIRPLLEWAGRHFDKGEAKRIAYAIQQKIAREGTAPTFFVRRTIPVQRKILKAEVERELHRED